MHVYVISKIAYTCEYAHIRLSHRTYNCSVYPQRIHVETQRIIAEYDCNVYPQRIHVEIERMIAVYTCNVYMSEKNVFMQHIRASFTHICVALVAYTCEYARIRL